MTKPFPSGQYNIVDERTKAIIVQRLTSASGHLYGVERMAREEAPCIELMMQLQAVQASLNKVSVMMLEAHLETCLLAVVQGENLTERKRVLSEVASIFEISKKYNYFIEGELPDNGN